MTWQNFVKVMPTLFAAILIIIVGYLLGILLETIISKFLRRIGFDDLMERYKLSDAIKSYNPSAVCGKIVFWYVMVIFLHSGVTSLKITSLSNLLKDFANWLPNLFAAFVIFIVGLLIGQMLYNKVMENVKTKKSRVKPIAKTIKYLTIFFITLVAVGQLGIRIMLVEQTWLLIIGSIALAFAIAIGISLGYALKEPMKKGIKKLEKL